MFPAQHGHPQAAEALTAVVELPGLARENADIAIEDNILTVTGRIDFSMYEKLQPVYTEYNIGQVRRSFSLHLLPIASTCTRSVLR
jgi:HSP20 family protein